MHFLKQRDGTVTLFLSPSFHSHPLGKEISKSQKQSLSQAGKSPAFRIIQVTVSVDFIVHGCHFTNAATEALATTSSVVSQSFLKAHGLTSLLPVVEMLALLLFTRLVPSTYYALSLCLPLLHP